MASLALALVPMIESAGAALAAGAGSAAGAIGGMSTMEALSLGTTVFGGLSAIAQGNAQAQQLEIEAANKQAEATTTTINALREKNDQTDQLLDTLARQRVALAGDGADLSTGVRTQIFGNTLARGDFSRQQTGLDAAVSARAARLSSRGLMIGAGNARLAGLANAAGALGSYAMSRSNRGSVPRVRLG